MESGFVIQSIIIYGISAIFLYKLGSSYSISNRNIIYTESPSNYKLLWVAVLYFGLLSGIRYLTGTDTRNYVELYEFIDKNPNYNDEHFEIGWIFLMRCIAHFHLSSSFMLFFIGSLQIGFLCYGLRKYPSSLPYVLMCIILSGEMLSLWNGMRQQLVAFSMIAALPLLKEKKIIIFILTVLLLTLIHKSAIVLILFYPLYQYGRVIIPNKYLQLTIWIGFVILGQISIWKSYMMYVEQFGKMIGYIDSDASTMLAYFERVNEGSNIGFRSYLLYGVTGIILLSSTELFKRFYNDRAISFIYNLFLISILSSAILYGGRSLLRIFDYARPFYFVTLGLTLSTLFKSNFSNRKYGTLILLMLIINLLVTLFLATGNGGALYKCIWWDK